MGERVEISRADGTTLPVYVAQADENAPGVVVIQEYWGLNEQISSIADRIAAAGFNAIVPDLYRGKVAADSDEAWHMMEDLDFKNAEADIQACLQHLKKNGHDAGVMGFCLGGLLTIMAAANLDEPDAAVCYYGIPPAAAADPKKIRCKLIGHFASEDDWCTPNLVDTLEELLEEGSVEHVFYRYEAEHAFANASRTEVYDDEKAELAWERTIAFLFGALT
jgi:carboxymethylenebutenolidase